jgi:hypothetical protein
MTNPLSILLACAVLASGATPQKTPLPPRSVSDSAVESCVPGEKPVVRDTDRPSCFRFYCDSKENKAPVLGCVPPGQSPQLVRIPEMPTSSSDLILIGFAQLKLEPIKCLTYVSELQALARCKPQSAKLRYEWRPIDSCANFFCATKEQDLVVKVCPPSNSKYAQVNVDTDKQKMPEHGQWSGLQVCFTNVLNPADEPCLDPQSSQYLSLSSFPWCVAP